MMRGSCSINGGCGTGGQGAGSGRAVWAAKWNPQPPRPHWWDMA